MAKKPLLSCAEAERLPNAAIARMARGFAAEGTG
jgi:hypothetical protein